MRNVLLLLAVLIGSLTRLNADWPQWRGPEFNGSSAETGLPEAWTKTENIAWVTPLPGPSAATPIIWGDHVFVSSTDAGQDALIACALDRKTGRIRWRHQISEGPIRRDDRSTFAAPSPATDGERVIFFYSNGDLAAFDFQGELLWRRSITQKYGEFNFQWTFSSSPLLFDGRLYLQILQRDTPVRGRGRPNAESYLLALDPATGKELWRQVRPSEAYAESREAFTTPIPFSWQGKSEILIAGGDCLTGHDPKTGKELWRWGTWNPRRIGHWRLVPSPIAGAGIILACAPKREPIYAVKAGANGNVPDSDLAWTSAEERVLSSDVPTPLFYDGSFFVLSDVRKSLSRVEPRTGKILWTKELPGFGLYRSSPTGADGKLYFMNHDANVLVMRASDGSLVHQIAMGESGERNRSSIAVAQGQLFIRTMDRLYCVGK